MGLGARVSLGLTALVVGAMGLVYLNEAFAQAPVYMGAESAHLIRALYGKAPALGQLDLPPADDIAFTLLIRGLTYLTQTLLPWLRLLGGAAYVAGLLLVFQVSRRNMAAPAAVSVLLLALAYPYHRFAFSALPEGWYVLGLGASVLLTARIYLTQPLVHGVLAGCLAAGLMLLKPQGLAVSAAFLVLAGVDLALGRRSWRAFAGRILTFAAGFLLTANGLHLLAGGDGVAPLSFFPAGHYGRFLHGGVDQPAWIASARGLAAMICGAVILAAVPALTGLLRIELRWLWTRGHGRFALEPQETAFLFTLLCLVFSIALTALLAAGGDPARLWGRQFEAYAPMLWLAAAPFIAEFDKHGGARWRTAMAAAPAAGLAGLIVCLLDGAVARPWDAAALSAFQLPAPVGFLAGALVILAAAVAIAASRLAVLRVWLFGVLALALLATAADLGWRRSQGRLDTELAAADALISQRPGEVALLASDPMERRFGYLMLRARPTIVLARADDRRLAGADTIVSLGGQPSAPGWRIIFKGEAITIFAR